MLSIPLDQGQSHTREIVEPNRPRDEEYARVRFTQGGKLVQCPAHISAIARNQDSPLRRSESKLLDVAASVHIGFM